MAECRDIGRAVTFAALAAGVAGVAFHRAQCGNNRALAVRLVEGHIGLPSECGIAAADRAERVGQVGVLEVSFIQRFGVRVRVQRVQIIALGNLGGSSVNRAEYGAARFAGGVAAGDGDFPLHSAAPVHIALDLACDAAGGRAGDLAGVVAACNSHFAAGAADDAASLAAGRGNFCGVIAAGDGRAVADCAADNAAGAAAAGDSAEVRAVLDHGVLIGVSHKTADVVAGRGDDCVVEAVRDFRSSAAGIAGDRACAALAGNCAADGQIMDVGIRADLRKQASRGVQAVDLKACAVKHDLLAGGDVQPCVFAEVDIGRQNAGNVRVLALRDEPCQLRAGADLVNAVFVGLRFGLRLAVPCARCGCLQGDGEFVGAFLRHGDAASGVFNASAGNGVEVFLGISLERAVFRDRNAVACAVRQRDGQILAVNGRAVLILEAQLAGQEVELYDRDRDLRQTAENACRLGRVEAGIRAHSIGDAAVRRNAGPARLLDRAAQRVGLLSPELRDGDSQLLPLRVAAEVINAEVSAGITLEEGAVRALHIQGEVEVIRAGKLFLGADQVGELDRDGIARLDGSQLFLRQLRALRVDELVAHAACRHDLIGRKAALRDLDDIAAGDQTADGHSAVFSGCDASVCEAAGIRHRRSGHGGAQDAHGAARFGLEAVTCTLCSSVEQNVMLRIELPRLILLDDRIHAVKIHIGLDSTAVRADIHDKHARQLRPDGGEAMRGRAGLASHMGHCVIGYEHDGRALVLGLHHSDVAVQRVRRDGHDVAGIAVHINDLIVHLRQCDLGVHKAFDREPVAEGVELERLANGHVFIALGVDVQVNACTVVDVVFKMIDRALVEITGQAEILFRDRVRCVGAQSDVVPVCCTLRMADTVEVIRVLVEMERGRAVLDGTRERLKEAEHIVFCERTGVDGRALRRCDRDRDEFLAGQAEAVVHCRGLGSGSRVVVRMRFRVRRGCHADCITNDKQAACIGRAPVYSRAELCLALRAGSVGHVQREGVVRISDPAAGVDGDLIHPLQLEAAVLAADVDHHAAVAVIVRVIAVNPVSAGRKVDGIRAVCGCLRGQQIVRALHAVHVGIQLQGLDLCVVHTGQCDADIALCCQNACGQQAQQHHKHEQQTQNSFLHTFFLQNQNIYRKLLIK